MKITIKGICLENFRSFVGSHQLELPTGPGLYIIQGENQVDPSLGSNGAGKSSLLDSIPWAIYGHTSKGRRSHQVASWENPEATRVDLALRIDGKICTIERGYKPNFLRLNDDSIEDERLADIFGLSFQEFTSSIFIGQFSGMFFDLGPKEKLEFLSGLLNLDYWSDCSDRANTKKKELLEELNITKSRIDTLSAKKSEMLRSADEIYKRMKEAKGEDISALLSSISDLEAEISKCESRIRSVKASLTDPMTKLAKWEQEFKKLQEMEINLVSEQNKALRKHASASQSLKTIKESLDRLDKGASSGKCPTCGQSLVSKDHINDERKRLQGESVVLTNQVKTASDEEFNISSKLKATKKEVADSRDSSQSIRSQINNTNAEIHSLESSLSEKLRSHKALNQQLEEHKTRANKLLISFRTESLRARQTEYQIMSEEDNLNDIEAKATAAEFWVKGFHHLRMKLLEEALQRFELEATNALAELGLPDWSFKCLTERETKAGTISRGIRFLVCRPGREAYDLEDESGGELQRIRLSGTVGLSAVVLDRRGIEPTFEVWDEPTRHLSPEGIQDLLSCLSERAKRTGRAVYLIDHHSLDSGKAEGLIKVIKDKDGSRVEVA